MALTDNIKWVDRGFIRWVDRTAIKWVPARVTETLVKAYMFLSGKKAGTVSFSSRSGGAVQFSSKNPADITITGRDS